jgi:hypothetical protein
MFLPRIDYDTFYVVYPFVTYLLVLPRRQKRRQMDRYIARQMDRQTEGQTIGY